MISKISLLRSTIKYNSFNGILKPKSYLYRSNLFEFSKRILEDTKNSPPIPDKLFKMINHHKFNKNKPSKKVKPDHKTTTQQAINRQLLNDSIQLPLKFVASYLSGWSGTFYAQFIKSIIDFCNHLFLYGTSKLNTQPTQSYPYGNIKIKQIVCYIPATLFLVFGIHVCYQGIYDIFHQKQSIFSIYCVYIYIVTMIVQLYVVVRNIKVANSLSRPNQGEISIIQKLKQLKSGKDPLFRAILYENLITVVSTSIPLACSCIPYIQQIGTISIGLIQLFLASHLLSTTSESLQGQKSIEPHLIERIQHLILRNQFVEKIVDLKAVKIDHQTFRLSLELRMDLEKLKKQSQRDYYEYSNTFLYEQNLEQRQKLLNKFLDDATLSVYNEAQDQLQQIEADILNEFPNCIQIDLDIANDDEDNLDDKQEEIVFHQIIQQQTPQKFKIDTKWILQKADKIIGKHPKKQLGKEQSVLHEFRGMDDADIQQFIFLNEDLRFEVYSEILNQQMKNK